MKEQHVICFMAAARNRNISLAAQDLHMSQQAVSRSIRQLEEELGFTLFHRRNDGVQLTEIGSRYYNQFYEFSRRIYEAASLAVSDPRLVRIGWGSWTGCPDWLLRRLREERARASELRYEVRVCPIAELLSGRDLDIVLVTEQLLPYVDGRFRRLSLGRLPIYLAAGAGVSAERLARLPHLDSEELERNHALSEQRIRRCYEQLGLPPRPVELLPNQASVFAQVQLGGGVCFSPENDVLRDAARFQARPLDWSLELFALLRDTASPGAEAFWSQLRGGAEEP